MNKPFVLGVDIGGTNIKLGLVDAAGKIISKSNLVTATFLSHKNQLIDGLLQGCEQLIQKNYLQKNDIAGIGIGLPGLIDAQKGIARFLPNIPGWKNVALKNIIEKKIGVATFIDNDVNLMTLGEWKFGAGQGFSNMVCMTLGTGVGGGLIINNELYRGEGFSAGELGHIPLNEEGPPCNCGGKGCLERYVGNKYLLEKAQKLFKKKHISLEEINHLASLGNPKALQFWQETGTYIGLGLVSVVNILNPQRIIIGGGISNASKHLFPVIEETIKTRAMNIPARMVKIVKAKLADEAGIMGAYVLLNFCQLMEHLLD